MLRNWKIAYKIMLLPAVAMPRNEDLMNEIETQLLSGLIGGVGW